jgi:hypothetical protein
VFGTQKSKGRDMTKYFFDLKGQHCCAYDYQGRMLAGPEQALRYAELLALDLEMNPDGQWSGWAVNVRDACGGQLCSVPVRCPDLVAA